MEGKRKKDKQRGGKYLIGNAKHDAEVDNEVNYLVVIIRGGGKDRDDDGRMFN